jgi:hypothetical protein
LENHPSVNPKKGSPTAPLGLKAPVGLSRPKRFRICAVGLCFTLKSVWKERFMTMTGENENLNEDYREADDGATDADEADQDALDEGSTPTEETFDSLDSALDAAEVAKAPEATGDISVLPAKMNDADLFRLMGTSDGLEAMLAQTAISMSLLGEDSARQALGADDASVREQHLKMATQANATLLKFAKAIGEHRQSRQPKRVLQSFSFKG